MCVWLFGPPKLRRFYQFVPLTLILSIVIWVAAHLADGACWWTVFCAWICIGTNLWSIGMAVYQSHDVRSGFCCMVAPDWAGKSVLWHQRNFYGFAFLAMIPAASFSVIAGTKIMIRDLNDYECTVYCWIPDDSLDLHTFRHNCDTCLFSGNVSRDLSFDMASVTAECLALDGKKVFSQTTSRNDTFLCPSVCDESKKMETCRTSVHNLGSTDLCRNCDFCNEEGYNSWLSVSSEKYLPLSCKTNNVDKGECVDLCTCFGGRTYPHSRRRGRQKKRNSNYNRHGSATQCETEYLRASFTLLCGGLGMVLGVALFHLCKEANKELINQLATDPEAHKYLENLTSAIAEAEQPTSSPWTTSERWNIQSRSDSVDCPYCPVDENGLPVSMRSPAIPPQMATIPPQMATIPPQMATIPPRQRSPVHELRMANNRDLNAAHFHTTITGVPVSFGGKGLGLGGGKVGFGGKEGFYFGGGKPGPWGVGKVGKGEAFYGVGGGGKKGGGGGGFIPMVDNRIDEIPPIPQSISAPSSPTSRQMTPSSFFPTIGMVEFSGSGPSTEAANTIERERPYQISDEVIEVRLPIRRHSLREESSGVYSMTREELFGMTREESYEESSLACEDKPVCFESDSISFSRACSEDERGSTMEYDYRSSSGDLEFQTRKIDDSGSFLQNRSSSSKSRHEEDCLPDMPLDEILPQFSETSTLRNSQSDGCCAEDVRLEMRESEGLESNECGVNETVRLDSKGKKLG